MSLALSVDRGFCFGTKSETLRDLQAFAGDFEIPKSLIYSKKDWVESHQKVLAEIQMAFDPHNLAIRSSALSEDTESSSNAGKFTSIIGVSPCNLLELKQSINEVFASYASDENFNNQVLIQRQVENVDIAGVVLTRDLNDGAPYYCINYDDISGRTDTVTSGSGLQKTIYIQRNVSEAQIRSKRIARVVRLARSLESIIGDLPLDIEFAIDKNERVYVFQVRQIPTKNSWRSKNDTALVNGISSLRGFVADKLSPKNGVVGPNSILTNMSDWNPAEMIGTNPRPLAISFYRELITKDVWRLSRAEMGYKPIAACELMYSLAGQPYIDARASFNSFLPIGLTDSTEKKLIQCEIDLLTQSPEFHDKVEFEIVPTILDFNSDNFLKSRYGGELNNVEQSEIIAALKKMTRQIVSIEKGGSLQMAEDKISVLATRQENRGKLNFDSLAPSASVISDVLFLIDECKHFGTRPFAILARHAFIAKSLLNTAVEKCAISSERACEFLQSIHTIASKISTDMALVSRGKKSIESFMTSYGHIRPGAYDILSERYDALPDLFIGSRTQKTKRTALFQLINSETRQIQKLLADIDLDLSANDLFEYMRRSIVAREYGKFIFSRNLSDAIELLAQWGRNNELSRDQISFLSFENLAATQISGGFADIRTNLQNLSEAQNEDYQRSSLVRLPYLIRDVDDLLIVPCHRSTPNFVTANRITGKVLCINNNTNPEAAEFTGAVVVIEGADPGYDWIFSKPIVGLITKYGGANSHMSIRCAEFGLPAAIGCGEQMFNKITRAKSVEIDAACKTLRPLD
jgi:phosphohistidine swiveling domain-containing protein